MKKLFAQKKLYIFFLITNLITFSKEQPHQTTATSGNFSYSQSFESSRNNAEHANQSGFFASSSNQTTFPYSQQLAYSQEQLNDLVLLAYLKKQIGESSFTQFMHECHVNEYGCSANHLKEIIKYYNFEELEHLIINDQSLTKEQALNTWQWFCNQKYGRSGKKNDGYESIVQKYEKKEKAQLKQLEKEQTLKQERQKLEKEQRDKQELLERQKKEELRVLKQAEQCGALRLRTQKEFIQNNLKKCGLDSDQCIYLPQDFELLKDQYKYVDQFCKEKFEHKALPIWSERLDALQKTKEQNFAQSFQETTLSPQACGYLLASDLQLNNYQSCYGTAFQQQLNLEICSSFENIAKAQQSFLLPSSFLRAATQCADAAHWSNQFESMPITMHLIDLGNACYKVGEWTMLNGPIYAQAVIDGVVESVWDFAHMVTHPTELVQNIGQAAWFVLDTMALTDQDSIGATLPIAQEQLKERIDTVNSAVRTMHEIAINSTGPQRVKMATKLTTDCLFMHKATQAVGAVAGVMQTQSRAMRSIEYASEALSHEPAFASAAENVSQATKELEAFIQKSVAQEMAPIAESLEKAGIVSAEIRTATRSITEITADIEKVAVQIPLGNGKLSFQVPLNNVELCNEVKTLTEELVKESNAIINQAFRNQFLSKWTIENGLKKRVTMNINHILNYEVSFSANKKLGIMEIEFSGGHLAGSTEALAEKGLIRIINKQQLPTGCWEFTFEECFTGKEFTKTEFHVSWNEQKILKNSWDLFENQLIAEYPVKGGKVGKFKIIEEQELSIVIKKHEKDINITTSVPYKIEEEIL